jgi:hypothetical protein
MIPRYRFGDHGRRCIIKEGGRPFLDHPKDRPVPEDRAFVPQQLGKLGKMAGRSCILIEQPSI